MVPECYLSLWMVLKMRNSIRWFCPEDNTEQSESNLGRSLGIYNWGEESCLEDSTTLLCSFASSTRYCLPDSCFIYHVNPETASRVTLASLGIGFQPNLMVIGCLWIKHQCLILWFCCGIKYQYKKTKKNIFVYFYLLIFYSSTIQPTTNNHLLLISSKLATCEISENLADSNS